MIKLFPKSCLIIIFLNSIIIGGCAGRIDLSEHLATNPPRGYSRGFNRPLPYDFIVKAIHDAESTSFPSENFTRAIYIINESSIIYTLDRLNVAGNLKVRILNNLSKSRTDLAVFYHKEFKKAEEIAVGKWGREQVISYPYHTSIDKFARVMAHNVCSIVDRFVGIVIPDPKVQLSAMILSKPFEILLFEAFLPIAEEMRNHALILDHINARIQIKSHLRKMIMQLATVEDKLETQAEINPTRKIWFIESRATIKCDATAIIKAGFDLEKRFIVDIDPKSEQVDVYLPSAEILSFDVYPSFKSIEDGWLIDANEEHVNQLQTLLRSRLRNEAIESGILRDAEKHAENVVQKLMMPMMQTPYFSYNIIVHFGG